MKILASLQKCSDKQRSILLCILQELILFSRADLERSIPSMVDGLKPGQRKILFCCFKRNIRKDVKASTPPVA